MTVRTVAYILAALGWLAVLAFSHFLVEPVSHYRVLQALVGMYATRYLIERATRASGNFGIATIDKQTPRAMRLVFDLAVVGLAIYLLNALL